MIKSKNKIIYPLIVILLVNAAILFFPFFTNDKATIVSPSQLDMKVKSGEVKELMIDVHGATLSARYETPEGIFEANLPNTQEIMNNFKQFDIVLKEKETFFKVENILFAGLITAGLLYVFNLYTKFKMNSDMNKKLADISTISPTIVGTMPENKKSIAKTVCSEVKLIDVAGCEEEKKEVTEIIDFLKYPKKYTDMGATIPKGIMLVGPPGTGKTLLAKAIAGEAGVHFLYASGSEFIEKYVGVGAKRVREIFDEAKANTPAILFIDEIDAIGKQRGGANGSEEHDQTLNQLLIELDGIQTTSQLIVIAATNRPEILDKAFMRKGRFDRMITISLPDLKAREEILEVHSKNKRFEKDVQIEAIAKKTHGFSGADLYALLNEAALLAVRNNKQAIGDSEIDEAIDRVLMGHAKPKKYSTEEKRLIAYHESGHVVLGLKLSSADKIDKVTIVPRGSAGGYAMLSPVNERFVLTEQELREKICGLLAGRAAEKICCKKITTGARNDLEQATKIARSMVTEYGMSPLGLVQMEGNTENYAGYINERQNYSQALARDIDKEVNDIINECFTKSEAVLKDNLPLLDALATDLMEKETLSAKDIQRIENDFR